MGRGGSGGARRGGKETSMATLIQTRSSKRLQERALPCSSSVAVAGSDDPPTSSRSRRSAAVEQIESGNDDVQVIEGAASTMKSKSESRRKSRSSAMTPASPPEPRAAQKSTDRVSRNCRKSPTVGLIQDKTVPKTSLSTVKKGPRRKSRSTVGSASGLTSKKANVNKAGPSRKRLNRAEKIQLEAKQIPSVKTSTWNPFTLFPLEIWEMIFDNLADSKDLENVMNATPEWRKMYQPKMVKILFQQALTIMAKEESYLKKKDYFQCRRVCRSWDQSVQNYVQWHPVHLDMLLDEEAMISGRTYSNIYPHQVWQENSLEWFFDQDEELPEFLVELAKTHPHPFDRNPFLSRQITIDEVISARPRANQVPIADLQRWRSSVGNLLERYGKHVWDCKIEYSRWKVLSLTWQSWHINILHWITLMQNLKVLNLSYDNQYGQPIQHRERIALENHIGINPLPEWKDLIVLKTCDLPGPVFNELIQKATNLEKLKVNLPRLKAGARLSHYQLNMLASQNLTECELNLTRPEDFKHLESTGVSWPLKKLHLNLGKFEVDWEILKSLKWPSWNCIFKVIEVKFGATLLELQLRLPKATEAAVAEKILNKSPSYRLNLPHVKCLRICVPNLASFDFLLPMQSLEELFVVLRHMESDGKNASLLKKKDILKFTGNFHRLFETNVWDKLPKLKHIKLSLCQKPVPFSFNEYVIHNYDKKTKKHTCSPATELNEWLDSENDHYE